jgi:DNA repair and recombination protein RAD54B
MVISYEMFVRYVEDIKKIKFDLVICDEAHRLKNAAIKTTMVRPFLCKILLLT